MSRQLLLLALNFVFAGGLVGGCALVGDDPKRAFSLSNDADGARVVRRCDGFGCQSPGKAELVRPGESLDFKLYFEEDRTYVVGDAEGNTLGCLSVPLADGSSDYPGSLSDLEPCPPGMSKNANTES